MVGEVLGIICISIAILWSVIGGVAMFCQIIKEDYYEYEPIVFSPKKDRIIGICLCVIAITLCIIALVLIINDLRGA